MIDKTGRIKISRQAMDEMTTAAKNAQIHELSPEQFYEAVCKEAPRVSSGVVMEFLFNFYDQIYFGLPERMRQRVKRQPFYYLKGKKRVWVGPWRTEGGSFQPKGR